MTAAEAISQPNQTASWGARAGAFAVDLLPGAVVLTTAALVALSVPHRAVLWWVCIAVAALATLWTAFNRIMLPRITGASVGHAAFGISVLDDDGRKVESDSIASPRTRIKLRRLAIPVMMTAAAWCASGAAASYLVVRQHDQSVVDTTAQIAAEGPRMVAQILSYRPETINADFDHARSLTTDTYRVELSALQQTTLKSSPVANEYWVTRSSVLDATPDRATMLLFLQGQRGSAPNRRDIAASVRATFVRSDRAGWRIDDVAVVTEPRVTGAKS